MTESLGIAQRLAFLDFGEGDRRALASLRPLLEANAERLVAHFYRHLLSFEPTRRLLRDPEVKERLLTLQRDYLLSLAGPRIDEAFAADRLRIGRTHERVGLDVQWYLGAYSLYFSLLLPLIHERYEGDAPRCERTIAALVKLLILDASLAMGAYIEDRQSALEEANRELAEIGRSLERQIEAAGLALSKTTRRARAAEELASIATLVAGLAHEIGTPMSVIQGHAELLESAVSEPRARERLAIIRGQVDRISRIIQTLLRVARPHPPVRTRLSLDDLIHTTLSFVREKLQRRQIQVDCELDAPTSISGDADRIQQLFLNLFLNAADAMPQGGTLRVRARQVDDCVEIRISDTGRGIPPKDLEHVFEPFYTTKPAGQGSGLGLVVASGIVLDHDGEIDVTSEEGKGTEFRIQLPTRDAAAG
ncbi:MAG: protoglobin domain-containing protein [Myxococcota bacterium]